MTAPAFMDHVAVHRRVSFDLWLKMRAATVLAVGGGYADHAWEYYLPGPHLRHMLAREAERTN